MAKKASKIIRLIRSSRADHLDRLPQFEPDRIFRLDEHDSVLPFPESRASRIRDVLTSAMKDHVRKAQFLGEPTSLKRFLANAMLAIARYESRSLRRRLYDRRRASGLVKKAIVALGALQQTLEDTVEWKQLDRYLEMLFVAACKQNERQRGEREGRRPVAGLSVRAVVQRRKQADRYRAQFHARSPRKLLELVRFLEPLLFLSLQKLEFQAGDFQRNEIVRKFADEMVFAWRSATGAIPTISKSKRPSAFQRLLATINREILKPETRHRTDFRSPAVVAAERARKRYMGKNPSP
jgi:hypothetical protein